MAIGLPVIGTDVGGVKEVIDINEGVGWLVPNNDVEALADKMLYVLKLPYEVRINIGLKAKKYVEQKFSPYTYLKNIQNLYNSLFYKKGD